MESKKSKKKDNKGGKRPGAGRKKGSLNKTTIERNKVLDLAKDIIAGRTRKLIDTQSVLAMGALKVFCIRSHWEGSGKNKKLIRDKAFLVENEEDIIKILDYEYGDGEDPNKHEHGEDWDYFFVVTKDPENNAINSLLDRTFGRPTEHKVLESTKGMGALLDDLEDEDND